MDVRTRRRHLAECREELADVRDMLSELRGAGPMDDATAEDVDEIDRLTGLAVERLDRAHARQG